MRFPKGAQVRIDAPGALHGRDSVVLGGPMDKVPLLITTVGGGGWVYGDPPYYLLRADGGTEDFIAAVNVDAVVAR